MTESDIVTEGVESLLFCLPGVGLTTLLGGLEARLTKLEARFMIGFAPVQWSNDSRASMSQIVSGSTLTPALQREWKLDHRSGFNFRTFFSISDAAPQFVSNIDIKRVRS